MASTAIRVPYPRLRNTPLLPFLLLLATWTPSCRAQDSNEASSRFQTVSAAAQSPDSTLTAKSQASATSSAPAQTHTIQAGLADHKFRPEVTDAAVGDTIEFRFYPTNHSVVRAEYRFPCIPYEMTGSNKKGFFSGFNAMDKVLDDPPKYQIRVNDSSPIFFYCSAPGSCITYAMVGAINPNSSTPISKQQDLARNSSYMLNPGQPFPAESPLPSLSSAAHTEKKGLGGGAIAGIVIASLSVVVLAALLFFFWGRTKTLKDEVDRKESTITRHVSPSSSTAAMMEIGHSSASSNGSAGVFQHYTQRPGYQTPPTTTSSMNPYSPATYFSSSTNAVAAASRIQRAPSHRSVGGTFELSPTGDYTRSPVESYAVSQHQHYHRSASPHCLEDTKLGPYGRQVLNEEPAPSYYDTVYKPMPVHVNQVQGPAEMEATVPAPRTAVRKPTWQEVKVEGRMV